MAKRAFVLTARVSTDNPKAIKPVLKELLPEAFVAVPADSD